MKHSRQRSPRAAQIIAGALAVVGAFVTVAPVPTAGAVTPAGLNSGQSLKCGGVRKSPDAMVRVVMQCDGNLVVYRGSTVPWASETNGLGGKTLKMQKDGNLVIYTSKNKAVWASRTQGHSGAYLRIQNDNNLVIYSKTKVPLWDSQGHFPRSTPGGLISREHMIARARYWVGNPPPGGYNPNGSHTDPWGRSYRTDCSGFVSMAWNLANQQSTVGLGSDQYTRAITKGQLRKGDIMNIDVSGDAGHVRMFLGWNDAAKTSYHFIDFGSGAAPSEKNDAYPGSKLGRSYEPRRYNKVLEWILV